MSFWTMNCLMVQRVSLTDSTRNTLLLAAIEMLRRRGEKGAGRRRVKTDDIEGLISTRFRPAFLGSISGIEFSADVETDLGKGKVRFLVDPGFCGLDVEEVMDVRWQDVTDRFRKATSAPYN